MSSNSEPPTCITETKAWKGLEEHYESMADTSLLSLFGEDDFSLITSSDGTSAQPSANRFTFFHEVIDGLLYDYSKTHVSEETIELLLTLAQECRVEDWRDKMFSGNAINNSENRSVLHCALRKSVAKSLMVDGENVRDFVRDTSEAIERLSEKIRESSHITDVVHIGIGGSDLGPRLVCDALENYADGPRVHFVANIDGQEITHLLKNLHPAGTAFVIASKTFTTLETMTNAHTAKSWIVEALGETAITDHFFAVSNNVEAAEAFGIDHKNILPLRDWVGGRYSVWGAIGLPIAISLGFERFQEFLNGAHAMDMHFKKAPLRHNIPVLMALIGIWYRNFYGCSNYCVVPYAQNLEYFPSYLQQLDMESNGKSVTRDGKTITYATGPSVFGEPGSNAQHAFFQLLHQGTDVIPVDFIAFVHAFHDLQGHQDALMANALAQSKALMQGQANKEEPHRNFEGNRPSVTLLLEQLDAYHLGMLMALYEHKVFVQGIIWNINSFDQWGVELGKTLAAPITSALQEKTIPKDTDSSTYGLIKAILNDRISKDDL